MVFIQNSPFAKVLTNSPAHRAWIYTASLWISTALLAINVHALWPLIVVALIGTAWLLRRVYWCLNPIDALAQYLGGSCLVITIWMFTLWVSLPILGQLGSLGAIVALMLVPGSLCIPAVGMAWIAGPWKPPRWVVTKPLRVALIVAILITLRGWASWRDSEAYLRSRFSNHRTEIEQLVEMFKEDHKKTHTPRIQLDAWDPDNGSSITRGRWEEYRSLSRMAGMSEWLQATGRDEQAVALIVHRRRGMIAQDSQRGFLWSPERPIAKNGPGYANSYTPLDGNWYTFEWTW